jgi:hypothetical protein
MLEQWPYVLLLCVSVFALGFTLGYSRRQKKFEAVLDLLRDREQQWHQASAECARLSQIIKDLRGN